MGVLGWMLRQVGTRPGGVDLHAMHPLWYHVVHMHYNL
jgi:hypothetical protein